MFTDEARVQVRSGRGGDGVVHFRREKYVPRGGPDGGDGGKGGDVILRVSPHLNTLTSFRKLQSLRAEDGGKGGGGNRTGRGGDDMVAEVPPGTIVRLEEGALLGDLTEPGQTLTVARGGRGGRGNARFATPSNQAPRMAERGEPGEERRLQLELRLLADVGILGLPNAGKSSLLAAATNARPKIAGYPFTTLVPNLGVAELDGDVMLVLADIPGLIEGAHEGVGLGIGFLRHLGRTRALIHVLDGTSPDPLADLSQVNVELALFDPALAELPQVVAVNKMDLPEAIERWPGLRRDLQAREIEALPISALARTGVRELLYAAHRAAQAARAAPVEELPVYRPAPPETTFDLGREPDGSWRVSGKAIERAAEMTYWEYDEAVRRFHATLVRLGIDEALRQAGVREGDTVHIGEYELEWRS